VRGRSFVERCHVLFYVVFKISPATWLHGALSDEFAVGTHWCN